MAFIASYTTFRCPARRGLGLLGHQLRPGPAGRTRVRCPPGSGLPHRRSCGYRVGHQMEMVGPAAQPANPEGASCAAACGYLIFSQLEL